jgi:hypothetical protein
MDLRPDLGPIWDAFGLPATLVVPGGQPISLRAVWINLQTVEAPIGGEARVAEQRRPLAMRRSEAIYVLRDSRITVAEHEGGAAREWRVDGFGRIDSEIIEVLVVPGP